MTQYFGLGTFIPHHGTGIHAHENSLDQLGEQCCVPNSSFVAPLNTLANPFIAPHGLQNIGSLTPGYGLGTSFGDLNQGTLTNGTTIAFIPTGTVNQVEGTHTPWGTQTSWGTTAGVNHWLCGNHGNSCGALQPSFATELAETTSEFILSFDVPGMEVHNIDVSLSGDTLYIQGIRTDLQEASALTYSEVAHGNISRTFRLPFDASAQKEINTSLENGVLKIRIRKEDQISKKTGSRKIQIS